LAEKDEKKADSGKKNILEEFEKEEHRRMAKRYLKQYLDRGYGKDYARRLAILRVKSDMRTEDILKTDNSIQARKNKWSAATDPSEKSSLRELIKALVMDKDKFQGEKDSIEEEISRIETKFTTPIANTQAEMERELQEIEDIKSGLEEGEYENEKRKIEEKYREILSGKKLEAGKGYPIISSERQHAKKLFRGRLPFTKIGTPKALPFKRPCPNCGKKTLVEYVDEKTGAIYYKCSNPNCRNVGDRIEPTAAGIKGNKMPFFGLNARERANKRLAFEKRLEPIQKKYWKGEIDDDEYQRQKDALETEISTSGTVHKKGWAVDRVGGPLNKLAKKGGEGMLHAFFAACLVGIGALISAIFGNWWFFFGFLSVSINFLIPSPDKGEFEKMPMGWGHILPWAQGGSHAGFAWMKSITKVSAIIFFAYGFKSMGDVFNVFFIITCLAGYFSLKLTYSPERPGDFIESLLRFGILGCYFIPFIVFAGIFNSYVLAAIAFAFFAIPPMPETSKGQNLGEILSRGLSGQTAYYEMFDKLLFIVLMGFALIASGSLGGIANFLNLGWQLTGTLKYTFIYFWVVALIGGFFSPARERPLTGMLFLGGATIIYGIGPGSQDIGSALLGQWWPTVNENVMAIAEPISKMFGQLGKTFGDAFLLLTNPVGYATQLMNGSYSNNPVGETGAYGLELSGFDVSPVFIMQPFMITANIKNNGAFPAEAVSIFMSAGAKAPEKQGGVSLPVLGEKTPTIAITKTGTRPLQISEIGIDTKEDSTQCDNAKTTWHDWKFFKWFGFDAGKDDVCVHIYPEDNFARQNIWQTTFSSTGITCQISSNFELRKKSIPINITLNYKYQSDSKIPIEFISRAEWDRLARLDQLNTRLQFVKSEYSSAPVKFPIGTPGLKNPILETQDFHIALNLMSDQIGGRIEGVESIVLNYPTDFVLANDKCSPDPTTGGGSYAPGKVEWKNLNVGDKIFFCHFNKLSSTNALGSSPTKTYIITAHASYTYSNTQNKLVKVDFGSWCCTQETDVCTKEQKCCPEDKKSGKGICAPSEQNCEGGTGGTTGAPPTDVNCEKLLQDDCLKNKEKCNWQPAEDEKYYCAKKVY
jgi:hypothetical protein